MGDEVVVQVWLSRKSWNWRLQQLHDLYHSVDSVLSHPVVKYLSYGHAFCGNEMRVLSSIQSVESWQLSRDTTTKWHSNASKYMTSLLCPFYILSEMVKNKNVLVCDGIFITVISRLL